MRTDNGSVVVAEVKLVDGMYQGIYMDKTITRQHTAEKAFQKMYLYLKGQK